MKVAIGADHAGFDLKQELADDLREAGYTVEDFGPASTESVDYPDFARRVAEAVRGGRAERGVLVCGTGIGIGIAANTVAGIRAATCNDLFTARMCRAHNDAQIVALGSRVVGPGVAGEIVRIFLETSFEGGRHQRRVDKIHRIETSETT